MHNNPGFVEFLITKGDLILGWALGLMSTGLVALIGFFIRKHKEKPKIEFDASFKGLHGPYGPGYYAVLFITIVNKSSIAGYYNNLQIEIKSESFNVVFFKIIFNKTEGYRVQIGRPDNNVPIKISHDERILIPRNAVDVFSSGVTIPPNETKAGFAFFPIGGNDNLQARIQSLEGSKLLITHHGTGKHFSGFIKMNDDRNRNKSNKESHEDEK